MKAKCILNDETKAFAAKLKEATEAGDEKAVQKAYEDFFANVEENILAEAKSFNVEAADAATLAQRGVRGLTTEEKGFFKSFISAAKEEESGSVAKALNAMKEVWPESEVNAIFDEMKEAHPILGHIKMMDTAALTKFIFNKNGSQKAQWGKMTEAKKAKLTEDLEVVELVLGKLTAHMIVSKDMLDLGPVWVEKYVRTILAEAFANGLADGFINGNGLDGNPIGMIRDFAKPLDQHSGFPEKVAEKLTELTPETYGALLAKLAKNANGITRNVTKVTCIVNPVTYFQKLFPATTMMTAGGYVSDRFPYPTDVCQEANLAENKMILGIDKEYLAGFGLGKNGKIEYDDSTQFIEDNRVYSVKGFANGRARDNSCFLVCDISQLKSLKWPVPVEPAAPAGAAG